MQRLIEKLFLEAEIMGAVVSRRPRSLVLFVMALLLPLILLAVLTPLLSQGGFGDAFRPFASLVSLALMLKLMAGALGTYLRDRATVLRY